jgi:uncharacterized protein (DUF4415 family)
MKSKRTSTPSHKPDVPYDAKDKTKVAAFWADATAHVGIEELRAKRGRPAKAELDRKEQIALRLDADVLAWYRSLGAGWQTRMNAVLKAYRDATV